MKSPEARAIERVVVLHGLALSPALMWPLATRLKRSGWDVHRIGYPSTEHDLSAIVAMIRARLEALAPLHIVGHSLGGVIGAALLRAEDNPAVGRVVQLGSPNLGSPQADRALKIAPARWYYGPVLTDLRPHGQEPEPDRRIGAIVGAVWPNLAGGQGDGVVRIESAVAGAGDHVIVHHTHTMLPFSAEVARHAHTFLSEGHFRRDA